MAKQIVLLDYGHSKVDPKNGKHSPDKSFYEWEWNRAFGRALRDELVKNGIDVREIVTADEDEKTVTISTRAARANEICKKEGTANCMYVSIHSNALGDGTQWMTARGWQVHVSPKGSQASKDLADSIYDAVAIEGFKVRPESPTQKWRPGNFTVLNNTDCKAVLVENLFYDNKEDLELLQDEATMKKLLRGHTIGILNYMGLEPVQETPENTCCCCCNCCCKK